uniref:Mediator of RNA polymerase II transcription subunit 23 isoform X2 n=1 Tax=Rhizophora mucronata TaxID=61149 RepID=A0A2P2KA29_RHIMU
MECCLLQVQCQIQLLCSLQILRLHWLQFMVLVHLLNLGLSHHLLQLCLLSSCLIFLVMANN